MRHSVFWQTLRETQRTLLYWTLGLAGLAWLVLLARPLAVRLPGDEAGLVDLPVWLSFLLGEASGMAGIGVWLRVVGFGLILPLSLVVFAVYQGSWLVAGEEERSSLGLLLAAPLQRYRLILEKFAVLVLLSLAPAAGVWLALSLVRWLGWLPVSGAGLAGASVILFLVGLAFGAQAMALGSLTGKGWLSFGITLGTALLMLVISRLPGSLPIQPVLRLISPFYYYNAALLNHSYWAHVLALVLITAAGLLLAWMVFEHRDLPA